MRDLVVIAIISVLALGTKAFFVGTPIYWLAKLYREAATKIGNKIFRREISDYWCKFTISHSLSFSGIR